MAGWFARLMQKGHPRSPRSNAGAGVSSSTEVGHPPEARDTRYDAVVQVLRDREVEDRQAREKRQRWYNQHLKTDAGLASSASGPAAPVRLYRFRTKVPCRATPEARALLDELRKRFSGRTVTFPHLTSGQQAVMLDGDAGREPTQIGWVEHCVQADPTLCNVRHQGLAAETDDGRMLVLRFRYPPTAARMSSSRITEEARVDFTEIRPALDLRPSDKAPSPRLVWVTRPEVETMKAVGNRDYEAFYVRFKLELLAGIWSSLSSVLSNSPASQWHQGSHYTVVRDPDATTGKIRQRTVDDSGRVVDIGSDRIYDAFPATDILLLYLEGDILADIADIYFTLQSLRSTDGYFLKEEFFAVIRRFWAGSQGLASRYGSHLAAVIRMSQRAVPMPAQVPLLKQDWIHLRQSLVDRYGDGGRKAADLIGQDVYRPRIGPPGWPFASFPAGEVNVGLRVIYRQEWRHLGVQRGVVIAPKSGTCDGADEPRTIETTVEHGDTARNLDELVDDVVNATIDLMKWPLDFEGSINTGVRGLAATTDMGVESESRESSRDTSMRLSDMMARTASTLGDDADAVASAEAETSVESSAPTDFETSSDDDAGTYVYSRLQHRYEILTRPAEIQNVVLVAEKLPAPAEIDRSWVRRHDWILAKVLLDESFRDTLETIGQDPPDEPLQRDLELDATRDRLYDHLRANILHYQRAIWQQEDPQQRSMRYRKAGKKVPLEWRFELESGAALTIDDLGDRLTAANVDGQFAAYSAGRDADLDQVIDPAGPIGYYGNYAIYHMRPEFASEELFSMLHFFKSPYLRPNPGTGEPEVDDPVQIQIADDPAVVAATDHAIAQHRDEMFASVPELRAELARAREQVIDGTDPSAVDRLKHDRGALRRHFAAFLFRRERARQIALDTDGVVIDLIRPADPPPEEPDRNDGGIGLMAALEEFQLVLGAGREASLMGANDRREAGATRVILRGDGERMARVHAGAGGNGGTPGTHDRVLLRAVDGEEMPRVSAGRTHDHAVPVILARDDHEPGPRLVANGGDPQAREWVIAARDDQSPRHSVRGGQASDLAAPLIAARAEGDGTHRVRAGRTHDPKGERMIRVIVVGDGLRPVAGGGTAPAQERVIVVHEDEWLRPSPIAG